MTPIDLLVNRLAENGILHSSDIAEAKEMEKQQHEKTWTAGLYCETGDRQAFVEYYNETYCKSINNKG